jgi:transketolase
MVSCRKAFTASLLEQARKNPSLYAIATDSRGSVTLSNFAKELPGQFVEMGIAEQNALAFAAGLSTTGKRVFVSGPACFLAARGFEQIKVDVAYNESDVKVVGVSAGVSYGPLGGTHTCLHDFASLRALPNIEVFAPCDALETEVVTRYLCSKTGPAYMRTGRGDVEAVYESGETFVMGKAKQACAGKDITIIACGEMVAQACAASKRLASEGLSVRVLDMLPLNRLTQRR